MGWIGRSENGCVEYCKFTLYNGIYCTYEFSTSSGSAEERSVAATAGAASGGHSQAAVREVLALSVGPAPDSQAAAAAKLEAGDRTLTVDADASGAPVPCE